MYALTDPFNVGESHAVTRGCLLKAARPQMFVSSMMRNGAPAQQSKHAQLRPEKLKLPKAVTLLGVCGCSSSGSAEVPFPCEPHAKTSGIIYR